MSLSIVEVSPRDGLQDEPVMLPTDIKVSLIGQAIDAGSEPRRGGELRPPGPGTRPWPMPRRYWPGSVRRPGVRLAGLVLNEKGLERALAAGVDEINVVVLVSETFSRRNQGLGVDEALHMWSRVAAHAAGPTSGPP